VDVDKPDERSIITYVAQFISAANSNPPKIKSRSNSRRSSSNSMDKSPLQHETKAIDSSKKPAEMKSDNEHHTSLRLATYEPDPEIDPALILNASTTANFLERRRARRASLGGPQTMDDEALRNLIVATSPVSSETGGASTPSDDVMTAGGALSSSTPGVYAGTMSGSPSPPSYSTSPHRSARARSYAGLRLCRVAKNVSKCRAIANIRVTAEPPKATRNIVPVLHLGGEVHIIDFLFYTITQLEHESMAAYIRELDERKRQGLLLGLRPEELERAEAEWSRVKPELDEWRWRLDSVLPGEWRQVGHWLSKLEKCLINDALISSQLGLELAPEAKNLTMKEREERLQNCLDEHEEIYKNIDDLDNMINRLSEENKKILSLAENASEEVLQTLPVHLPQNIVNSLRSRFITAYLDGQLAKRRLQRLALRWYLANKEYLTSLNLPEDMNTSLEKLKQLAGERDDIACRTDEQREQMELKADLSNSLSQQQASVTAGGGAFILMDYAETERREANLFLSSLQTRWKDTWSDLLDLQSHLGEFCMKWDQYETEKANLGNWLCDVKKRLADETTNSEEREKLYTELKEWRTRVSALNDLGHELMHTCDMTAISTLDSELENMNKTWTEVTSEALL
ncbi:unnamed protein product, partial [Trichobilharzia regenti]